MDPGIMLFCIAAAIAGSGMGLFSGMTPGIHVNTLAAMMVSASVSYTHLTLPTN